MFTSGRASNAEYFYIEQAKNCANKRNDFKPNNNGSSCGKHKHCKYCEYNLTGLKRDCYYFVQDDTSAINKFIDKLRARLSGSTYIEECNCHEDGHVREDFICDKEDHTC